MKSIIVQALNRFTLAGFIFLGSIIPVLTVNAQHKLNIVLNNPNNLLADGPVFLAGNFNGWNPANAAYQLKKNNDNFELVLYDLPPDVYEFKFTRGSWSTVQCTKTGADINNHLIKLTSDSTVFYSIDAWKDEFGTVEKKHTASVNVTVVDTAFFIPQLNRHRRIVIYLPPGYEKTNKRYPVMYMQDGQNIFDEFTSGFGEWGVDELLDSLINSGENACIVVGVDNGPKRINEYNPFDFEKFGPGEGEAYVRFLKETLKPYIDSAYRTLGNSANTIIAGSSMGGLISYYALLTHPEVFGKAGVFSPAFWTANGIKEMTDSLGHNVSGKLFFYMGGLEGGEYIDDMQDVSERLGKYSKAMIYAAIDDEGRHNEAAWHKWFAEFYKWIMADGYNYIINTSN